MNEVLEELENIQFNVRKPMFKDNTRKNILGGQDKEIEAIVLGLTRDYAKPNLVPSKYTRMDKYKRLHTLLKKLIKEKDPNYKYTTIQVNKNVETAFHKDKNNIGKSYCLSLGDFTGGALELKKGNGIIPLNTKNRMVLYDGTIEHRTGKYKGTRYAIIWFKRR